MRRICLVTCYMGPLAGYYAYFRMSALLNPSIDFLVIGDHVATQGSANFSGMNMSMKDLNVLATRTLGHTVRLASPWKINELKPAFGVVFAGLLKDYDFWGYCDIDIIWGRIRRFFPDDLLDEYDVFSSKQHWTAGHFTMFRNNEICNQLFRSNPGFPELINDSRYYAFEESCHRWEGQVTPVKELVRRGEKPSMFDLVHAAQTEGKLRALFRELVREHPDPIDYIFEDGKLTDRRTNSEFMYHHLITVKKIWRFYIPDYQPVPQAFVTTPQGIRANNDPFIRWWCARLIHAFKSIFRSLGKRSVRQTFSRLIKGPGFEPLR